MPPWLTLWQHDVAGIMSFTSEYVSKAVQKFRGRVSFWHAAAFTQEIVDDLRTQMSQEEAEGYANAARFDFSWSGLARYWRSRNL